MSDYISRYEIFSVWRSMPKPASIASLTDAINRTPAADVEPVRRWIPCSERLPGEKQRVLFWVPSNEAIYAGFYNYTGKRGTAWFRAGKSDYASKYWMPLPEPPEEGDAGNGLD